MSNTIAQIQANLLEEDLSADSENTPLQNTDEEEERQLDQAVATLDPIQQIKLQREQDKLEILRRKDQEQQFDRSEKLKREADKLRKDIADAAIKAQEGDKKAAKDLENAQEKLRINQQRQKDQEARKQGNLIKTGTDAFAGAQEQIFDTADKIRDTAGGFWDSIGRISVPGSIWLPLVILLIFFFLLLPVNGQTRAQWLFLALTGQAHIDTGGSGAGGTGFTGVSNL